MQRFGATTVDTTHASETWIYGGTFYVDLLVRGGEAVRISEISCQFLRIRVRVVEIILLRRIVAAGCGGA